MTNERFQMVIADAKMIKDKFQMFHLSL